MKYNIIKHNIRRLVAVMVSVVTLFGFGALAHADGTGAWCAELDHTTASLCMTFDGTVGNPVTGQLLNTGSNQEFVTVGGVSVCKKANGSGTEYVQNGQGTDGPPCPFTNGSGLNTKYDHKEIVNIWNSLENNYCGVGTRDGGEVYQESCSHSGNEWVQIPGGDSGYVSWVSVYATDNNNGDYTPLLACARAPEGRSLLVEPATGDGGCEFNGLTN